ncbi:MAG TPA: hypothetical protein VEY30_13315, partial [Myxococcaceae bacterium]|nr:hypothetical protein [Myxococcaceae bacterium]
MNLRFRPIRRDGRVIACAAVLAAAACADQPAGVAELGTGLLPDRPTAVTTVACQASIASKVVSCGAPADADQRVYGGQNVYVKVTSSNVQVDAGVGIFSFDVTVQNLLNEAIGTPDGVIVDPDGISVFFSRGPVTTSGIGEVSVSNHDGNGFFTAGNQPYF